MDTEETEDVPTETVEALQNKALQLSKTRNSRRVGEEDCILAQAILATVEYTTSQQSAWAFILGGTGT